MRKRSRIREEELNQILSNSELDETAKADAIKQLVGNNYIPLNKYNTEKQKLQSQNAQLSADFENFKQSKMTDEEKQAEQAKQMEERYQKANLTISKMYAENTFAKAGIEEDDYKDIIENIVTEDPDKTKGLAETICNAMLKQKSNIEKDIKDKIVKGTPKPQTGSTEEGDKKEDYKALFDEASKKHDLVKMAYYTRLMQENK